MIWEIARECGQISLCAKIALCNPVNIAVAIIPAVATGVSLLQSNLPANLQRWRGIKKYTQKHLAKMLGVSQAVISEWERGHRHPTLEHLLSLSQHYEVTLDHLLFYPAHRHPFCENVLCGMYLRFTEAPLTEKERRKHWRLYMKLFNLTLAESKTDRVENCETLNAVVDGMIQSRIRSKKHKKASVVKLPRAIPR
jgi:transcriptional regulator with XRE-family HTH domain